MRAFALTAHGLCDVPEAEALVLDWFESEGFELVHGQDGVLIGWSETSLLPNGSEPTLSAEIRLYDLGQGWLQMRCTLRLSGSEMLRIWAEQLLFSLRRHLANQPVWQIDGP